MSPVRKSRRDDLDKVHHIADISLDEDYTGELFIAIKEMWGDGFLVYEINGRIVGFICGTILDQKSVRVLMLAVHPLYRNHGIGSELLQRFVEVSSSMGATRVVLEVRVSSSKAIEFYQKRGFQVTDKLEDFYTNGEDGYKMVRYL